MANTNMFIRFHNGKGRDLIAKIRSNQKFDLSLRCKVAPFFRFTKSTSIKFTYRGREVEETDTPKSIGIDDFVSSQRAVPILVEKR